MWSTSMTGIFIYALFLLIILIFLYYIIRNIKASHITEKHSIIIEANGKAKFYLDDERKIALNVSLIKTIYIKDECIYAELFGNDTYIIKKCIESESPQKELESIINIINKDLEHN